MDLTQEADPNVVKSCDGIGYFGCYPPLSLAHPTGKNYCVCTFQRFISIIQFPPTSTELPYALIIDGEHQVRGPQQGRRFCVELFADDADFLESSHYFHH